MKVILQRVTKASVTINGAVKGSIDKGYMVLLGVGESDTEAQADKLVDKISKLRIFEDENGKTNLSASDVNGEILVISQFTLYADCKKGNRPSFIGAGSPRHANKLYEYFVKQCEDKFAKVQSGEFGADMKVELINDGPFTIYLDSDIWEK